MLALRRAFINAYGVMCIGWKDQAQGLMEIGR